MMNSELLEAAGEPSLPDDADHSVLQQPLYAGVKNVKQILKCVQSGSREIKDIVLNECNIIYECKVCKNLFRSLANFLYHKRCFCKEHLCEGMLLFEHFEESQTVVVQPEPAPEETKDMDIEVKKNTDVEEEPPNLSLQEPDVEINGVAESSPLDKDQPILETTVSAETQQKENKSDDHPICEPTPNNTESPSRTVVSPIKIMGHSFLKVAVKDKRIEGCKSVQIKVLTNKKGEQKPAIILRPIDGSKHAVFQEMEGKQPKDSTSVDAENKNSNTKEITILTSTPDKDGILHLSPSTDSNFNSPNKDEGTKKINDIHLTRRKRLLNRTDCQVQSLKCLKCDTEFTTLRTLYFHMMSLHSKKRMYYPCPFCKTLFVQMYGVTRHLIAVHNKTKDQIDNKMREAIRKGAIWKRVDEAKAEQKEAYEKENQADDAVKTEVISSPEQSPTENKIVDDKVLHSCIKVELTEHQCSKCKRVFGRKSSQVSHQKFCIMNNNSPKPESREQSSPSPTRPSYSPVKPQLAVVSRKLDFEEPKVNLRPKRGAEKRIHKDFVDSQTLKWRSANKIETTNRAPVTSQNKIAFKSHEKKIKAIVNIDKLLCLKCNRRFSSFSNLRRHAAIHIGWTRFECKSCNYQSYNKSECRHHLERVHNINEVNVDKYIINLVTDISQGKLMNSTIPKAASQNDKKKSYVANKNKIINKRKRIRKKSSSISSNASSTRYRASPRKSTSDENSSSSPSSKRQKKPKIVTETKSSPVRKVQNNYKSVTTNCPTTIILSKTSPTTTVQMPKSASLLVAQNTESSSSAEKSTRMSPRKFEVTMKVMTDTMKQSPMPKNSLPFPTRIFSSTPKTEFIDLHSRAEVEKSNNKKNRVISDWFIKKDKMNNMQFPPVKRESAPLIIGVFPASSSGNASSQKK